MTEGVGGACGGGSGGSGGGGSGSITFLRGRGSAGGGTGDWTGLGRAVDAGRLVPHQAAGSGPGASWAAVNPALSRRRAGGAPGHPASGSWGMA